MNYLWVSFIIAWGLYFIYLFSMDRQLRRVKRSLAARSEASKQD